MKQLHDLSAGRTTDVNPVVASTIAVVADMPAPGVIRKISLTADGVIVQRPMVDGPALQVCVPLAELLSLAEAAEPMLAVKPQKVREN